MATVNNLDAPGSENIATAVPSAVSVSNIDLPITVFVSIAFALGWVLGAWI